MFLQPLLSLVIRSSDSIKLPKVIEVGLVMCEVETGINHLSEITVKCLVGIKYFSNIVGKNVNPWACDTFKEGVVYIGYEYFNHSIVEETIVMLCQLQ